MSRNAMAGRWIERLGLEPHREGGYYREVYRSRRVVEIDVARGGGSRSLVTAIYFLVEAPDFSALHRVRHDELWHFYDGTSLTLHTIDRDGAYVPLVLGHDPDGPGLPQVLIPGGTLFGATVNDPDGYALVGCTVSPGFEFEDFEMPTRGELLVAHPQHRELIERLTRR